MLYRSLLLFPSLLNKITMDAWQHQGKKKHVEAPALLKITCVSLMRKGLENHWPSPTAQVGLQWKAP